MTTRTQIAQAVAITVIAIALSSAMAQGVKTINEPYAPPAAKEAELPFAPARASLPAAPRMEAAFTLHGGEPIHNDLTAWAKKQGWELYWLHRYSWRTLRDTAINKPEVTEAIAEVIDTLRDEGKPITLRISEGNRVIEVLSTEVRND